MYCTMPSGRRFGARALRPRGLHILLFLGMGLLDGFGAFDDPDDEPASREPAYISASRRRSRIAIACMELTRTRELPEEVKRHCKLQRTAPILLSPHGLYAIAHAAVGRPQSARRWSDSSKPPPARVLKPDSRRPAWLESPSHRKEAQVEAGSGSPRRIALAARVRTRRQALEEAAARESPPDEHSVAVKMAAASAAREAAAARVAALRAQARLAKAKTLEAASPPVRPASARAWAAVQEPDAALAARAAAAARVQAAASSAHASGSEHANEGGARSDGSGLTQRLSRDMMQCMLQRVEAKPPRSGAPAAATATEHRDAVGLSTPTHRPPPPPPPPAPPQTKREGVGGPRPPKQMRTVISASPKDLSFIPARPSVRRDALLDRVALA